MDVINIKNVLFLKYFKERINQFKKVIYLIISIFFTANAY